MEVIERKPETNKTKTDYSKVVWFYDFWSWLTESKAAGYVIKFSEIKDGETILEIACGTGVVFEKIVKQNPNGKNTGIDLSPDMLNKAKKRLKKLKSGNYELREGDVLKLGFNDNSFDLVVNNFMVDLMPAETFNILADKFYKITKPGGRVVISTFSFGKKRINKFWFWVAKNFPDILTGCRPVSFKENLMKAGFIIEKSIEISQNTFPSEILKARKRKNNQNLTNM